MTYTPRNNQKNKARQLWRGSRAITIATLIALATFMVATTNATANGTQPQLKILHMSCIDNLIGVRFGLVHAPQTQNYGVVQYTMTAPGNLIIVASAAFAEKTGNNAYYTDTVSGNNGVYTITAAHVTVNSTTYELENAGEQFNITNCHSQTSPSPTPSPSPSHSPAPSTTPSPSPSPTPTQISCPLQQQSNRTLINFNVNSFLRSDQGLSQATGGPFPVSLAPSTYTVTVTSYDKHSSKPQQLQLNERWLLTLRNSAGSTIATTNATSDLPENVDARTEIVNNNLDISGAIASVTTQHAAYPDTSSPNSITPVCAAFDRTTTTQPSPTPSPSPTPTPTPETQPASVGISVKKTDHRETIQVGQSLTYTIEVENTGEDDFTTVTIKDTVPSALTIKSISTGGVLKGHTITWHNIGLAAGEKILVTVTATVKVDTDAGHTLVNTVTARSEDKGPSATDTDTTVVEKQPRVAAAVTQDPAPVPITAATGANLGTALAALTSALSFTTLALKRWWT